MKQTILTNSEIERIADELLTKHGIQDYFDRMIYATAVHYDLVLLTEDNQLHELSRTNNAPRIKNTKLETITQ
ncbi:MAG: PIN domain-containing protein [Sulfolobales archaeon]